MSVIIREREREREHERDRDRDRDWDTTRSVYEGPRTFTTVRRYKVPERSSETDRFESETRGGETRIGETRIIRRERQPSPPDDIREWRIEREVDRDIDRRTRSPPSSARDYRSDHNYRIERDFGVERAPSPPAAYRREVRVVRNEDREEPSRRLPFDVERYSKSTEFFGRPEAPQPIIIREPAPQPIIIREAAPQPIIIRERSRERSPPRRQEESYEMIERSEVNDNRSIVRREEPPPPAPAPQPEKEDYYYERRIKEVERPQRRESWSDEEWDRRREVHPRESASQYGDDHWSSDEDLVYYKKRTGSRVGSREASPHHRRHLAEGALAGVVGGELLRRHRKNEGDAHGGRLSNAAAGGIVGAAGAEAVSRLRSRSRRRKEERSRSESDDRGRRHRHRHRHHHSHKDKEKSKSRSRERSKSRARQLAGLAGVAAVGALAGYALKQRNKNQQEVVIEDRGRSRSRVRPGSPESYESLPPEEARRGNSQHRNARVAQAGLASAAVAGLVERARSKSRQRKGDNRSRSRVRQAAPIAAAGLGGAALAGLYEQRKNKKAEREVEERSRSRPRSRSVPPYDDRRPANDPALVVYGGDPIYPGREEDHYRERDGRGYDDPADYRRHRRGSSASSSPGGGRSRSKSRTRRAAETAAVAGVAGVAAHKATQRSERKRAERERRRREEEEGYPPEDQGTYSPGHPAVNPYTQDPNYYPHNNNFAPPPNSGGYPPQQQAMHPEENPYPPYNPADYPPMSSGPQQALPQDQYFSPPPAGQQEQWSHQPAAGPAGHVPREHDPNDVSSSATAPIPTALFANRQQGSNGVTRRASQPVTHDADQVPDGVITPSPRTRTPRAGSLERGERREQERERTRASSVPSPGRKVQFNLQDEEHSESEISPMEEEPQPSSSSRNHRHRQQYERDDHDTRDLDGHGESHRQGDARQRRSAGNGNPHLDRDKQRSRGRDTSPTGSDDSEGTVDLPPRFDRKGRKIPEDPLAQSVQDMFQGRGMAGRLFHRFAGDIFR
ncbi:MAG: hypothetical protein Q9165_008472 [Trypethelium subeluteriae]